MNTRLDAAFHEAIAGYSSAMAADGVLAVTRHRRGGRGRGDCYRAGWLLTDMA